MPIIHTYSYLSVHSSNNSSLSNPPPPHSFKHFSGTFHLMSKDKKYMKFIFGEYMHYCGLCNNYVCILKMYENIHLVQYKFKVVSRDRVLKPAKTSSFLDNLKLLDKFVQVLGIPSSKLPVVGIWVLTNPKF